MSFLFCSGYLCAAWCDCKWRFQPKKRRALQIFGGYTIHLPKTHIHSKVPHHYHVKGKGNSVLLFPSVSVSGFYHFSQDSPMQPEPWLSPILYYFPFSLPAVVNCKDPVVQSGNWVSGSRPPHKHLASVTFECNTGYYMVGQRTQTCDISSEWSPGLPTCKCKLCVSLC